MCNNLTHIKEVLNCITNYQNLFLNQVFIDIIDDVGKGILNIEEGIKTELISYAFTGVNVIPTMIFILVQLYWLVAILGLFDLDFLDFDLDMEMDGDASGPLSAIAVFIEIGQVPVALVFSLIVLNFWILSMLLYFLPIVSGGIVNGLLLIPAFLLGVFISKFEVKPLRKIFEKRKSEDSAKAQVLAHRCVLMTDLEYGKLGQAKVDRKGASLVINVKPLFKEEAFEKDELAFVYRKDKVDDVYYIAKTLLKEEIKL